MPRKKLKPSDRKARAKASQRNYDQKRREEEAEAIRKAREVQPEGKGTNGAMQVFRVMERLA